MSNLREEWGLILLRVQQFLSITLGSHTGLTQPFVDEYMEASEIEATGQEPGAATLPSPNDLLLSAKLHLLKAPQPSNGATTRGPRFQNTSLGRMFQTQTKTLLGGFPS